MFLIVDTSVLVADPFRRSSGFITVMTERERLGITLLLPQIVIDETLNKCRERASDALEKAERAYGHLRSFAPGDLPPFPVTIETLMSPFAESLRELLAQGRVLPYPTIPHDIAVARALARRRPFKFVGEKSDGYRDFLIWMSVVEAAKAEKRNVGSFVKTRWTSGSARRATRSTRICNRISLPLGCQPTPFRSTPQSPTSLAGVRSRD
jgi:hypothetical protein